MLRSILLAAVCLFTYTANLSAKPIHVLMWDERQPRQEEAYDNWIGNEIVDRLKASTENMEFRSVSLDDPDQGLSEENLAWADVVLWWGHARHSDVTWDNAKKVADMVERGDLNIAILHSAHWSRPFVELMNRRSVEEGLAYIQKHNPGKKITHETVNPPKERSAPMYGSVLTPAYYGYRKGKTAVHGVIHLPWCCFPAFRNVGEPSTLITKNPYHPIAKGIPTSFEIPLTEMYDEPFHIPKPDEVIFEETWATGEWFRSGLIWNMGSGKVFYFRPGHETFPVFKQDEIVQILANTCEWLGRN